jgi:hypothetical protein
MSFLTSLESYQGIPYRHQGSDRHGCDCIGLVKLVWGDVFGVDLSPFDVPDRSPNPPARALVRGLTNAFGTPTSHLTDKSVVVFRSWQGAPQHCAIVAISERAPWILHADRAAGEVLLRRYVPSAGSPIYGVWC